MPARSTSADAGDRLLALLLLLPAAVLAWPFEGAPVADDAYPHLAGAAWVALAALPAAAFAAWRGRSGASPLFGLLCLVFAIGLFSARFANVTDGVEARRALVHGLAMLVLFGSASGLGADGRATLVRGLVVLTLAFVAGAFLRDDRALAGALGNTGALAQAALPGAIAGVWLAVSRGNPLWRVAGAAAFVAFAVHVVQAPVLASGAIAAGVLALSAALGAQFTWPWRAALLVAAASLPLAYVALRLRSDAPAGSGGAEALLAGATGGLGVRVAIWKRVPALLADHPITGVGPGQMQAAFPPYRDPEENAASSHGSCEDHATEVDHLHSDLLHELGELGLIGGAPWAIFLAAAAALGALAMQKPETARGALGAGAHGLVGNALLHSPLVFHPASAAIGFVMLGALAAHEGREPRDAREQPARARAPLALTLRIALPLAAAFALVLGLPLIQHGRELTRALRGRAETLAALAERATPSDEAAADWNRYARALEALPGSVAALHLLAERQRVDEPAAARTTYEQILAHRPHDQQALQTVALISLELGEPERARQSWRAALELDPGHPKVLRNLANLELDQGRVDEAARYLDTLEEIGCLDPAWLESLVVRMLQAGRGADAFALLARSDERCREPYGELAEALSKEAADAGKPDLASGLESAAHHLWARGHAETGDYATAVRSYRQAVRPIHAATGGGPPLLLFEQAAAQLLSGDAEDARKTVSGVKLDPATQALLPEWASAALGQAGIL